jgi:hypothetical protein
MHDTNFINLWALGLVLASSILPIAHAAAPVQPGVYDRDEWPATEDGKVLPDDARMIAN